MSANAVSAATSCSGATNGTITVTPTSGIAPYTFSLDGGAAVAGAAPYTFINVTAGPHTVTVTDGAGCVTNTINVTVTAGPALTTTATKTDVLCNGGATGTITVVQPSIGTAPYQYSLDGTTWQASNNFTGLVAGTYTVYYREANGCQGTLSIDVAEPTVLTATVAMIPVVCNGQNNGIITITSGGGISPYEYSIDGGTTWQSSNVFNVTAGNYTVTIRDVNNCITTQTINVTEPASLTAFSANSAASCDGGNDGVITVTANGGNSGYQYSLDGITFQSSNVFNVAPGNYTVTVKDNLGCTITFNTVVVLGSNFTLTPQTDPTICEGTSTQLQLVSNATQYVWTPSTGLSSTTIANPVANPTVTTTYYVTATLGRCSGVDTVIVNVNAAPIPNAGPDGFICYGQTYQLNASGGTQYSWSPNTYLNNPSVANPVSTPAKDIVYTLSILSDINGCASLTTDQMRIDVTPPIKVKTFPYDTVGYNGDQFQLLAVPSDSDVINYSWSPATGLSNPNIANPVVTAGAIGDVVQYRVITSTIAGCKGEGYVTVRVYKGPDIYVPTGFTPNGDGKNDKFTPFPVGIKSYKYFRVFNRWGQLIFSTTKLHDGWDGKLGGREQPSGAYVWMIEGVTKDDRIITKKGTVALIR
ncbi:MAG: gliding motility-associated C-terminal domain-containing protein [Chitinophagaceae bacterium]|nr:gliding motility-associated C-terminal domain-containing protein [Chitinophagaceae bacterium]